MIQTEMNGKTPALMAAEKTKNVTCQNLKFMPTFKDIEESIDTFSRDDGKNVKL